MGRTEIEDKRKHKRTSLTAHVTLVIGENEPPLVRHATIADISHGGAGLYLASPLEAGIRVKLEIRFIVVGGLKTETMKGKTIYSYPIQDTHYVGIEFDQELNPLHHPDLYGHIQNILNWA